MDNSQSHISQPTVHKLKFRNYFPLTILSIEDSYKLPTGMLRTISLILLVGTLAWAYQAIRPPPHNICGSPGGPPITSPRIKLRDGRYLAYKEHGVPKDKANYKVIFVHALYSCRHDFSFLPQEFAEEHGIFVVSFDRAGYGESDPNSNLTVKNTALDIEELADQLGLGSKFYVMGHSMGGLIIWGCLKYIPHRLLGASLLAPAINYWWPVFPANLSEKVYSELHLQDRWAYRVAHYTPWLAFWWNTQKWFPALTILTDESKVISQPDAEALSKFAATENLVYSTQQGEYESIYRDLTVGFGKWEFDPMDLENPFPSNEGSVHLWHGDQDLYVPLKLQRHIAKKLPWIQYHELTNAGHSFPYVDRMGETLFRELLLGKKQPA